MGVEQRLTPLIQSFFFEGREQPVSFVETTHVSDGVECDVYEFCGDTTKDLGVIRIARGKKTPLQRVLQGERTVEGFMSGNGKLSVVGVSGEKRVYAAEEGMREPVFVTVSIGEIMQWEADPDSSLMAYEVCFPPYEGGRYENIEEP